MVNKRFLAMWRRTLRPYWRSARPYIVVGSGLAVIVLGTIGYLQYSEDNGLGYDLADAMYRAVALFGLSGAHDPPLPWTLNVARFLGPLVFGYAALQALLALFRQEARLLWIRAVTRDHIVIAGLGEKGFRLAREFYKDDETVIVLDRTADSLRLPGMRERGITVLTGDATDRAVLQRAQVARAARLIVVCGSDAANIDVAGAAELLAKERGRGVLNTLVHLDDEHLWSMLSTAAVGTEHPRFRLDFFNVADLAARALIDKHPPFGPPGERHRHHVVVVGLHGVGRPFALRLAGAWRAESADRPTERMRVTLAGVGATARAARLREEHPELGSIVDLHAVEEVEDVDEPPTATFVCLPDEAESLSYALRLRSGISRDAPVVIAVADAESGVARALRAEGRAHETIAAFGVLSEALTKDFDRYSETEVLARAKHEEYVRDEARRGRTNPPLDVRELRSWSDLPDDLKESNRAFADGISSKLRDSGCLLIPAPLVDPADPGFAFTDEEVEPLAIKEHDRWMEEKLDQGWTYGPVKDEAQKTHPSLVPWEDLTEEDKDRDRDPVRDVPRMLAEAGFRIVRDTPEARVPVGDATPAA